jgi:uncharacterized damage-inducible protein DinB
MKPYFQELFSYTNHCNNALITAIVENEASVSEKCIQLISHIINVHQIWNAKFDQEKTAAIDPWKVHTAILLGELENHNFDRSLHILDHYELNDVIEWQTPTGIPFRNTTQDILFQIVNHSTYHRAQIATEFRKAGLTPLLTDFIYYKMQTTTV